jgi:hypothetical protein
MRGAIPSLEDILHFASGILARPPQRVPAGRQSFPIFHRVPVSFPTEIIDPRSEEISPITINDARTYFDLLLAAAPQAIAAYEAFIKKYEAVDAEARA